jgi:hypothetical protein
VEDRGFELGKCSRSKCASLDSIAASRAFSFLSCFIRSSCCILRCSYCSISFSTPGSRRQLSVDNNERHRGSDEPDAPLLRELEGGAGGEGDVVIGGEQGDQGDHDAGDGLDRSLAIEATAAAAAAAGGNGCYRQVWRRFSREIELHNRPGAATPRIVHLYDG